MRPKTPRVISGRAVCAGDCPMFQATGLPLQGYCLESRRMCAVGQLCFQPAGGNLPFARFTPRGSDPKIIPFKPRPTPPAKPVTKPKPSRPAARKRRAA
jgi:hypothetical protein